MKKDKTKEFIEKANRVHNNEYDYSKVVYKNNSTPVAITCKTHGVFYQRPDVHLQGRGCPECGGTKKLNNEKFIKKAEGVHGKKYDYSLVDYVNNKTKIKIICPEHGVFEQTPHNHLKGQGCPICGKSLTAHPKYGKMEFIAESINVHGNEYIYDDTEYKNLREKVKVICPEHGEFWQLPYLHLIGAGCPKCAKIKNGLNKRLSNQEFIEKAIKKHGEVYDYSKVNYVTAKKKVAIICKKHGIFLQTPDKHLSGCGCPKCIQPYSKDEIEIGNYITSILGPDSVILHDRNILDGKEIDIFVPSSNIAIEYNGLYWHTIEHTRESKYHYNKTMECANKGIKLFQVFEDEYHNHKEIVLSKIKHFLHKDNDLEKIYGRQCIIDECDNETAKNILEKNHIQGYVPSTVKLVAKYNDTPIAVMLFKKTKDDNVWELTRYASDINKHCVGVGGKLLSYFIKSYKPQKIFSFADIRWTVDKNNNIYTNLGFKLDYVIKPDYKYYNPNDGIIRQHKFNFRKQILHRKYGLPLTMTETEMTKKLGYSKIYDCGLIKYVWSKE